VCVCVCVCVCVVQGFEFRGSCLSPLLIEPCASHFAFSLFSRQALVLTLSQPVLNSNPPTSFTSPVAGITGVHPAQENNFEELLTVI
jgi:hypothetical protein